ncbi:MAG: 50S ribosomal protein L30 [Zetaproteobacteria bacterium CG_4_9_14_3_um_filter_49_83]|mgnify:CR=1 FL=1|nr:MAG: 50S ribosomal protein L30 [Zetaproteobacteria bacterium CG1_02_49_23]PIQ32697.1 MAG: 50S ribosomal protein L30 [Zetaproteobacteria bacterium CG17_big_fil_post_rev_8_21_14_2_50_50_13]PIV29931.1 MAG: 50S ribosomal protein L30 [Zetaproteobacteria bacterium CG02_land_8_20_14_3_00_50_9]PIY55302.1 MAG: 50S ribosomal protein L30 [Zetaproteobacteria bacterium CG_4_10_14_0_8_um_filter_49_80]PJA36114.1 MAG: 50S ribosomal protein L30 [Zetaproteobacteria bacterium CG_4_9_14_3_um_filter_49_83]
MVKKKTIQIRQVKSGIGYAKDQKATLIGLGFRRMNQVVELEDTPAVRGMVNKVRHLVQIETA